MTTISLGAKKFGTDLGMKAPAKRSTLIPQHYYKLNFLST